MDIETICAEVHKAYCEERIRQGKKPYWTGGDYGKLDEATKDYDRAAVHAVLAEVGYYKLHAENERLKKALEFYADENNYDELVSGRINILVDGGMLAKQALKEIRCFFPYSFFDGLSNWNR